MWSIIFVDSESVKFRMNSFGRQKIDKYFTRQKVDSTTLRTEKKFGSYLVLLSY